MSTCTDMTVCHFCSCSIKDLTIASNAGSTLEEVVHTIENFANIKKDAPVRQKIASILIPYFNSNFKFVCEGEDVLHACNDCLQKKGIVATLRAEYIQNLEYPVSFLDKVRRGLMCCSACKTFPVGGNVAIVSTSAEYGKFQSVDRLLGPIGYNRTPLLIRQAFLQAFGAFPAKHWMVLELPEEYLVLCPDCAYKSWSENIVPPAPARVSKFPAPVPQLASTEVPTVVPNFLVGGVFSPDAPYFWDTKPKNVPVGALNETSWKTCLMYTGQESKMYAILRWTNALKPLDWTTMSGMYNTESDLELQDEIIAQRLTDIMLPPKPCVVNTENRYARYVLENSMYGYKELYRLKLADLFKCLLRLHVVSESFPAFRAVYVGLWNLCGSDVKAKECIAKMTLRMFAHRGYRTSIFKMLMNEMNLLSFYDHASMFGKPEKEEQIWFANYSYLKNVAEMYALEARMEIVRGKPRTTRIQLEPETPNVLPKCDHYTCKLYPGECVFLCSKIKAKPCPPAPKTERTFIHTKSARPKCARVLFPGDSVVLKMPLTIGELEQELKQERAEYGFISPLKYSKEDCPRAEEKEKEEVVHEERKVTIQDVISDDDEYSGDDSGEDC